MESLPQLVQHYNVEPIPVSKQKSIGISISTRFIGPADVKEFSNCTDVVLTATQALHMILG